VTHPWVEVFLDGASRGNPGPAGLGVVFRQEDGPVLLTMKEYLGEVTNNVAEYRALLAALAEAARRGLKRLRIHTDSQLMQRQLVGVYRVRQPHLRRLHEEALRGLTFLEQYEILHVPRELNKEADGLANQAIEEHFRQ
jgi:ribonuclease HI